MFREVMMVEITEVLRLWLVGTAKKRIAAQLGFDPKTVRRYIKVAGQTGLQPGAVLTDERIRDVLIALQPSGGRPRGDRRAACVEPRAGMEAWGGPGNWLSKNPNPPRP